MNLLKFENSKLRDQFIFNLPAGLPTCGRICPGCYALKAEVRFPKTVKPYRQARLTASQSPNFASRIISELSSSRRTSRTVRIHESGDFYSQAYLDSWITIAQALPQFTFYAFTKRYSDFDFSIAKSTPNLVIINSLHSGSLNYGPLNTLDSSRPICPVTLNQPVTCGTTCRLCMSKSIESTSIQFVKH